MKRDAIGVILENQHRGALTVLRVIVDGNRIADSSHNVASRNRVCCQFIITMRRDTNITLFNQYLDALQRLAHQPILVEESTFVKTFLRALRVAVVATVEG